MNEKKVSIIIPLYNSEKDISRCIESIKAQQYNNYELIIVDDGSTDKSYLSAKRYENKNIHVYSKPNGGPSSARNFGLSLCSQDSSYVMFVDSDDTVSSNYIKDLVRVMDKSHDSFVICNMAHHTSESYVYSPHPVTISKIEEFDSFWHNKEFLKLLRNGIINSSCTKCYSLSVIRNNNLSFTDTFPEDLIFNIEYLNYVSKIKYVHGSLYNYIHRSGSITTKTHRQLIDNYIAIHADLYNLVSKKHRKYILEMVYPQYFAVLRRLIKDGDYITPRLYLKNKYVSDSVIAHSSTCPGDFVLKYLLLFRLFGLLKKL